MSISFAIQGESVTNNNVLVYGQPMSGKTVWVSTQTDREKTLHLQTDGNAASGSKLIIVNNWKDCIEAKDILLDHEDSDTIVIDLLDDIVSHAQTKAMQMLKMDGIADAKGAFNKLSNTVKQLVKEDFLRDLLASNKSMYIICHSKYDDKRMEYVPCFGAYTNEAIDIINWIKGRCYKVVHCEKQNEEYVVNIESERTGA